MRKKYNAGDSINGFKLIKRLQDSSSNSKGLFICRYCEHGFETLINHIASGHTKSCGCKTSEFRSKAMYKHGFTGTKLRKKWVVMKQRCNNPTQGSYYYYSKLGYDPTWEEFLPWLEYVTQLPSFPGYGSIENGDWTLHRRNNDRGYFPGNLEWLTKLEHNKIHWNG